MRWLERYLTESWRMLRHFEEVTADLARRETWTNAHGPPLRVTSVLWVPAELRRVAEHD